MQVFPFSQGRRRTVEARGPVVTVGPAGAMFTGQGHLALQGAIDYAARFGGGTVRVLPGRYRLSNAVFLPSAVSLEGSGEDCIFEKPSSFSTEVAEDFDGCRWFVAVRSFEGLKVGDGFTLSSQAIDGSGGWQHSLHTVCSLEGNRVYLDRLPGMAHWVKHGAKLRTIHSLIHVEGASEVTIRNIAIAGNRAGNELLDGNHGASIYMRQADNVRIESVSITDFNGDGISWQGCHDVVVENCHIEGMATLGLHPGSGSQRPVMRCNTILNCHDGIYWCWDVNHGIAEANTVSGCAQNGISIGHRDTDNAIARNTVADCAAAGIAFRTERSAVHTAHRTLIDGNIIKCPAAVPAARGIDVVRGVEDTMLRGNVIVLRGQPIENAIVVDKEATGTVQEANEVRHEAAAVASS